MDPSRASEDRGSLSGRGHVDGSTARRGTERPAAGRRRSSEFRGASVAARPLRRGRRARPAGVGSALAVLVAVLALGAAAPARAQTTLVSNFNQAEDSVTQFSVGVAQRFTTGSNASGYLVGSVEIKSEDPHGDTFSVSVCEVDVDGYPTSTCTALTSPSSFAAGTLVFNAPAGTTLSASTTYTVVITPTSSTVDFDATTADEEDAEGDAEWILANEFDFRSASVWQTSSTGKSLRVAIKGPVPVSRDAIPADWSLKPDAVGAGGRFRLLFVSSTVRTGDSTDIADYNAHVQDAAAAGHADIQAFADEFTAVGSTATVNVRLNTLTRAEDTGAPIYWLSTTATRSAVADDYADFYDGTMGDTGERTETGGTFNLFANPVATGSLTDGTTSIAPLGGDSNGFVTIWSQSGSNWNQQAGTTTDEFSLLALSPIFRVAGGASADATLSGLALTDDDGNTVELDPMFVPATTTYTATVANGVDEITVVATANDDTGADVEIQDGGGTELTDADVAAGFQVALAEGDNTIQVEVTAADGTIGLYSVVVTRALGGPRLVSAAVDPEGDLVKLTFNQVVESAPFGTPYGAAFNVTVDGVSTEINDTVGVSRSTETSGIDSYVLDISLGAVAFDPGATVVVEYTDPTAGDDGQAVQNVSGVDAASFTTGIDGVPAVVNNSTNHQPTSSDNTVTAIRPTDYTFTASDFPFIDGNAGDRLEHVAITTRPGAGKGTLKDDGSAISRVPRNISRDELDAGLLTYSPPAGQTGTGFATFKFRVDDGNVGSVAAYTMTIDVVVAATDCVGEGVWCATLTPQTLTDGHLGCGNGQAGNECWNTSHLTRDDFFHDETDYAVTAAQVRTDGELQMYLSEDLTAATQTLVLVVGTERFPFAHADTTRSNNRRWSDSGLSWSAGDPVDLKLVEGSSDATLTGLAIADGDGIAVALSPPFDADKTAYSASVAETVSRITVTATPNDATAKLDYLRADGNASPDRDTVLAGHQVNMHGGDNVILVRLTAEDGTVRTYTVTVAHPAAEDVVLVENIANTWLAFGYDKVTAQRFTTGSNRRGYRLDSATVAVESWSSGASGNHTLATVWSDAGALPDELIASLGPRPLVLGRRTYPAPGRLFLDPGEEYWVVFNYGLAGNQRVGLRNTEDVTDQSAYGWHIHDTVRWHDDAEPSDWYLTLQVLSMQLSGDELPLCPVTLGGRTEIWSGELTVGEKVGSFSNEYGFSGDADDGYGALSDVDFDFGSTTGVEISKIKVSSGVLAETLGFLAPDLPAADNSALRLHVCSDTFELADALSVTDNRAWAGTGLDWSGVRTVSLALSASADATLSALALDGTAVRGFAPGKYAYAVSVPVGTARITVTPTVNEGSALVAFLDGDDAALADADDMTDGHQVDLVDAETTVKVQVTAGDRGTTLVYTVVVRRALAPPRVTPTQGSTTSLDVSWTAPTAVTIAGYDVRYREGGSGSFADGPQGLTVISTSIPGLMTNRSYQVQVRATSADGDSEWSSSGTGLTHPPEVTVDSDFLLPAGLAAGTKFRLLYVSDGQKWNRSPIGRYNDWVQEFAAAGHDKILAYAPGFRAVGCDSKVNARVNTGTQWSTSDRGVPIHWLGGPIAADDYGDFYDGSWQNEDVPRTEAGEPKPAGFDGVVFTGCNDDGTTSTGFPLGAESSTHGKLASSNAGDGPLSSNFALKANRPIYGLSQVFVVSGGTDVTAPEVASIERQTPSSSPTNADSLTWRVTFDEPVANVHGADFAVAGTSAAPAVVEATSSVYDVTASGGDLADLNATVTLSFASGQDIADTAGNALSDTAPTGANEASYVVDNARPTVTITVPETSSAPFEATFVFLEAVNGFEVDDIDVGNGTASDFMGADGDTSYSAEIAPAADGDVTVDVAADMATDAAGNGNTAAAQATSDYTGGTGATLSGLEVSDNAGNAVELAPTFEADIDSYTATVAHDVDEITVVPTPNDTGASYEIQDGTGTALTDADTATDEFEVALDRGDNTIQVEVTADDGTTTGIYTVIVSRALARPRVTPTAGSTTSLDVSWTAPADTNVVGYDVQYREGGSGSFVDGPQSLTVTGTNLPNLKMNTLYEARVRMISDAGDSEWSANGKGLTHPPEVTVASDWSLLPGGLAAGAKFRLLYVSHNTRWNQSQIDRYNDWVQAYAAGNESGRGHEDIRAYASGFRAVGCDRWVNARVNTGTQWNASERGVPVYWLGGLIAADDYDDFYDESWQNEDAPRTEAGELKPSGFNGRVFTGCQDDGSISGSPLGREFSTVGILGSSIAGPLFSISPDSGNYPIYGLSQVFVVGASGDVTAPRVASIERRTPSSSPTNANSLTWRVTFDEPVTGVDADGADFAVAGTSATPAVVQVTTSVYDVTASGGDLAGLDATVTLSFASGQDIADTVGNALSNTTPTGADQADYVVDNTRPTVTITVPATSSGPFEATFVFLEAVSGFGLDHIDVGNGTRSDFVGVDGDTSYMAEIAPTANGTVTVDVGANVATDAAGNGNTAATRVTSDYTGSNEPPTFVEIDPNRTVAENTASGIEFGLPVTATDPDDDPLTYTLEGADAGSFGIDAGTGQLRTVAALDHETKASYTLTVKADDKRGGTDTFNVTVNVTDVDEKPATPAPPTVTTTANTTDSVDVSWTKPGLNGGPDIVGYKLRYEVTGSGSWAETSASATMAIIASLEEDTEYSVQVMALNGETPSDWSASGTGRTGGGSNEPPTFNDGASTIREVDENTASGRPVGAAVAASDPDGDTLTYTLEGADAASFRIGAGTGQLRTHAALDHETKASYTLTVKADDGRGGTDTIEVTVKVTLADEAPLACNMSMQPNPVTVHEGQTAHFTIVIDPPLPRDDILFWRVHPHGEASTPEDIPSTSGRADLKAGATSVVGAVTPNIDDETEPTEGFQIIMDWASWRALPDWRSTPSCTGRIYIRDGESNAPPVFADDAPPTRKVAENTASGRPVGKPVTAEDPNDDPVTYALEGRDRASFRIDAGTGQLRTRAALDHETKAAYAVTVRADDDRGGTATIAVTVNVADAREPPGTPDAPLVSASGRSLSVSWSAPENTGPSMTYDLRHREPGRGWRTDGPRDVDGLSATLDGLAADTEYEVQVMARNDEGASGWSASGRGRTGDNAPPVFADGEDTTRGVAENTASGRPVGRAVSADDPEGDELTYALEGPDAGSFRIDSGTGRLSTRAALDHESQAAYEVTVKADDGEGGTATIAVTVNVDDMVEKPETPDAPSVEGSGTSLSVRWSAPENTGPPVTYDLRYRETGGSWTDGPENVAGRSASIGGLAADTEYEAQVLARNDEGASGWSASGRGRTDGGERSLYMADVTVHEGEIARFTIVFSPARSDDDRLSWNTHGNSRARAGEDFARTSESIGLEAGATEVEGAVEVHADDEAEDEERFQIVITYGDVGDTVEYVGSIHIRDGQRPASASPSALVVGDLLTLRYPDPLDAGSTPGPKDWVVRAATDVGSRTLSVTGVSVSGAEVALVLSPPAAAGESVAVSYLPWAMHPLLGPEGAEAAPLTELPVRNETPASAPVEPPLAPLAAEAVLFAGEPAAGTPAPLGPWLSALLAERPAPSLVRLDLPDRGLTDVSALAGLTGLEVLDLHGNALADVWPLAGLSNLRRLDLSANRIGDVSALAGLAELEVLLLDGNRVADVLPLALLPRLARLDLSGNRVADAALLAELRLLARLDLSGNRVADASPLGDLSRLVWLDLTGNPVSDAAPLGRLTALRWLWLDADAPGLRALAPLAERPGPVRIEVGAPAGTPH